MKIIVCLGAHAHRETLHGNQGVIPPAPEVLVGDGISTDTITVQGQEEHASKFVGPVPFCDYCRAREWMPVKPIILAGRALSQYSLCQYDNDVRELVAQVTVWEGPPPPPLARHGRGYQSIAALGRSSFGSAWGAKLAFQLTDGEVLMRITSTQIISA